jgi:hypothetical protein
MKNSQLTLFSAVPILLLASVIQPYAQSTQLDTRPRTSSISGRVAVGGIPAANALVTVTEVDPKNRGGFDDARAQSAVFIKVRTDNDGRYSATGLPPGAYRINALSKAYVQAKDSINSDTSKTVTLDDGELREGFDFSLARGGAITGRVVDAEGRPLIEYFLRLLLVGDEGKPYSDSDLRMMRTDDRGIYRIYGLSAGRYIIGAENRWDYIHGKHRPETYYPGVTNQSEAKIIEVKEGAEVAGIDIRVGIEENTYEATGRVIDSETGQPLPQVRVMCSSESMGRVLGTDDEGLFRIKGLASGQYHLALVSRGALSSSALMGGNDYYSERTEFTVSGSDVSGLEVKAIRGSTIDGIVLLDEVDDPAIKAKLQNLYVTVNISSRTGSDEGSRNYESRGQSSTRVAGDGSFSLSGLAPGVAIFGLLENQESIFSIKRIERDGVEIRKDFEIGRGEKINNARIFVAYSNATIRGQVEIAGSNVPEGWHLNIWATPIGISIDDAGHPAFQSRDAQATVDDKGRFVLDGLPGGEYELRLHAMVRTAPNSWRNINGVDDLKQRVTIRSGSETQVKFVLDLPRRQQENRQ